VTQAVDTSNNMALKIPLTRSGARQASDIRAAELERETAEIHAIVESIGDGVLVIDEHQKIHYVNTRLKAMLGVTSRDLLGKTLEEAWRIEDEEGNAISSRKRGVNKAFSTGRRQELTLQDPRQYIVRKNGSRFPISYVATPILRDGAPAGAVAIIKDVSREHEINRMKSDFVSLASHQLRTPLAAIMLTVEFLERFDAGHMKHADLMKHLHAIAESSKTMADLVNLLLNVSRIDMGTLAVTYKQVNIAQLIEEEVHSIAKVAKANKRRLRAFLPSGGLTIKTDAAFVRIIVQNLISNAVKYSGTDTTVKVRALLRRGNALITVSDRGIGIPKKEQPHIFTKLYRASNAQKKRIEGSGLGLYIVKMMVEKLGGTIWFDSKPGEGTTFFVELPHHIHTG
jgi:PAS domain S-box-containing protein